MKPFVQVERSGLTAVAGPRYVNALECGGGGALIGWRK